MTIIKTPRHRKPLVPPRRPAIHTPLNPQRTSPTVAPCLDVSHAGGVVRRCRPYPAAAVHRAIKHLVFLLGLGWESRPGWRAGEEEVVFGVVVSGGGKGPRAHGCAMCGEPVGSEGLGD